MLAIAALLLNVSCGNPGDAELQDWREAVDSVGPEDQYTIADCQRIALAGLEVYERRDALPEDDVQAVLDEWAELRLQAAEGRMLPHFSCNVFFIFLDEYWDTVRGGRGTPIPVTPLTIQQYAERYCTEDEAMANTTMAVVMWDWAKIFKTLIQMRNEVVPPPKLRELDEAVLTFHAAYFTELRKFDPNEPIDSEVVQQGLEFWQYPHVRELHDRINEAIDALAPEVRAELQEYGCDFSASTPERAQ